MADLFFQLIQVAVGHRCKLDTVPSKDQWNELFEIAKRQSVIGVCADVIDKLPEEQRPSGHLALQWAVFTMRIEQRNKYLNEKLITVFRRLNKDGFATCLLKGQGVALYYPNPLRRQSGDLDIWAVPECMIGTGANFDFRDCRRRLVEYAHRHTPAAEICLHNIVFPVIKDVPIELHFIPSYFNNYFTEYRFKKYLRRNVSGQFKNVCALGVFCPTDDFNLIFLLAHTFKHFLLSGVGLRHIMDYYYLVKKWSNDGKLGDKKLMSGLRHDMESLGLMKFCGAMMWVLHHVFGLAEENMIVSPDERQGQLLLSKIMSGGNFGQYMKDAPFECKASDGHIVRLYKRTRTGLQMFRHYPSECIWNPVRIIEMFFILRLDRIKTTKHLF